MPRLSVLIPARNAAGTIESALRSTLRALPDDAEVLVLDERGDRTRYTRAKAWTPTGAELDRLAGRFAAKEAVLKVLQLPTTAVVPWQSIEVRTGRNGVPYIVLTGRALALAESQGIERIDISLSHDAGVAMAVAAAIPADDAPRNETDAPEDDE
jgi:phosphopantetheine--protein transferase-like protein